MLELRAAVEPGHAPRVVVAFRTDPDRQGESGDVDSWPPRGDPRVRLVLGSLLEGLAAKLRLYWVEGIGGFTAAVRAAYIFVKQRRYPRKWWVLGWRCCGKVCRLVACQGCCAVLTLGIACGRRVHGQLSALVAVPVVVLW